MNVNDKSACLRTQEHGHQPVVCYGVENHAQDCRVSLRDPIEPCQTLTGKMGTGGG